jgi:hypothetical protein
MRRFYKEGEKKDMLAYYSDKRQHMIKYKAKEDEGKAY